MITCGRCGRSNEEHYKFCLGCGANLDEQRNADQPTAEATTLAHCPQCGAALTPGQRFCGSCGCQLEAAAAQASVPNVELPMPTGDAAGRLVMINPDGSPGDSFPLVRGDNVIGRSSQAELFTRDPFLSPQHARFTVEAQSVRIADLDSLNGVYYRISEPTELQSGDYVRVGQELLRFEVIASSSPLVAEGGDGTSVSGSGHAGAWGRLERISAPGEASFTFLLRGTEQHLGRERGDILFRDDGYVSGKHARIYTDGGRYFVEDLQSSNGTFLRIRGEHTVPNNSLILMGQQPFKIQLD